MPRRTCARASGPRRHRSAASRPSARSWRTRQAAVNVASVLGARVIATTRRADRAGMLRSLGAESVVIETGSIAGEVRGLLPGGADRVLDLVGNSVLRDSLRTARAGGRVCQA